MMFKQKLLFIFSCFMPCISYAAQKAEGLTVADAYRDVMDSDYVDGVISLMESGANPNEKILDREETLLDLLANKRIIFGHMVEGTQPPAAGNYWRKAQEYNKAITLVLAGGAVHTEYFLGWCLDTLEKQKFLKAAIEDYHCGALWYNHNLPITLDKVLKPFNVATVVVEIIQSYVKKEIVPDRCFVSM